MKGNDQEKEKKEINKQTYLKKTDSKLKIKIKIRANQLISKNKPNKQIHK